MQIAYEDKLLELKIDENQENIEISLPLSATKIINDLELQILDVDDTHFASIQTSIINENLIFLFETKDLHFWGDAQKLTYLEKLRLCINAYEYQKHVDVMITCSLDSTNMLFDENLIPITLYRGIKGKIFPYTFTNLDFFENYRALVLTTLYPQFSFTELIEGAYPLIIGDHLLEEIAKVKDVKAIYNLLIAEYRKEKIAFHKKSIIVSKLSHNIYTVATYILCLVTITLASVLFYINRRTLPYQRDLLQVHDYFLSDDYQNVIASLKNYLPSKLPKSNQFELAISYVQIEDLSIEKKQEIVNLLNINNDIKYFQYWIYSGKGDLDNALDIAQKLDSNELIILILEKKINVIRNDTKISGIERKEQLNSVQNELAQYIDNIESEID